MTEYYCVHCKQLRSVEAPTDGSLPKCPTCGGLRTLLPTAKLKQALASVALPIVRPSSVVRQPSLIDLRKYYHVVDGYFECVVDERDATSCEEAFAVSQTNIHPWYFVGHKGELAGHVDVLNHTQYVDWLRKGML